jgi:hypothetical protein
MTVMTTLPFNDSLMPRALRQATRARNAIFAERAYKVPR